MSETVLHIDNVSKLYRLGQVGTGTLAHDLNRWWAKVRGQEDPFLKIGETNRQNEHGESDYVWALKDINLEVKQGEVLGIIGKNGAGKSTLLKILARVTGPTTGQIKVIGRIGSLLEVGTGFHPELTGRENIFLNGAILGMTRAEVRAKFDAIVDFAGIERYIDTPVKRYSSGMYVRLAFAVAAFLEPEILIVDEVLAVGDAEFQKRAIGKMEQVSKGDGRTVLFVSHNMGSIQTLCNRVVVLENGAINFDGETDKGIENYFGKNVVSLEKCFQKEGEKPASLSFKEIRVNASPNFSEIKAPKTLEDLYIKIKFDREIKSPLKGGRVDFRIDNATGQRLIWASTSLINDFQIAGEEIVFKIPRLPLNPGVFHVSLFLHDGLKVSDWKPTCFSFEVNESNNFGSGRQVPKNQSDLIIPFEVY